MSKPLRILLADDSRFFRTIEAKFLQKTPAEVVEAENCDQALDLIRELQPDLVYMAVSLRPQGGLACCEQVKADPALRAVPIVMICDQENATDQMAKARQAGCEETLVKPLDRFQFLQVGRQFLEGIREHRQPCFFSLQIRYGDNSFIGKCLDVSRGGMFVESKRDIPVGTRLDLSFRLPGSSLGELNCQAEVMWLNRRPEPMKPHYPQGLGLKFIVLADPVRAALMQHSQPR